MKTAISIIIGFIPFLLFAQGRSNKQHLINKDTLVIKTKLIGQNSRLIFESKPIHRSFSDEKAHFETTPLQLNMSDLEIDLVLKERHKAYHWSFDLGIIKANQDSIRPNIDQLKSDLINVSWSKSGEHQIVWEDLLENHLILNEPYDFFLISSLYGELDCQSDPVQFFRMEKEWPYLIGYTLGSAALISGAILRSEARDNYSDYLNIWENGSTLELATSEFEAAKVNKRNGESLLLAGGAVLLIQTYLLGKRYFKVRKQQRDYRFYCSQNVLQIQPSLVWVENPLLKSYHPIPGLRLSYQF